jgi:hypothetical protein
MAQWGRNDQAVTANTSTTVETSTGAPIGTWALVKGSGNGTTPIAMTPNGHFGNTSSGSRASVDVNMFGNTTPGAFIPGAAYGVFGAGADSSGAAGIELAVDNAAGRKLTHAGWQLRKAGTGPVIGVSFTGGAATAYNNADILVVRSTQAGGNAAISMTTNSTGGSLTLAITNAGAGFLVTSIPTSNLVITNTAGGTAAGNSTVTNFVVTVGGRAGRVQYETLVAMGSLGAQTAAYGTAAAVADASDDAILPDA